MFLKRLTPKEKECFISLAIRASETNGVTTDEEHAMLEEYCKEMEITFPAMGDIMGMNDITAVYHHSDISARKIVLLEIIGLMYADGDYDDDEKRFVGSFAEEIGLTKENIGTAENLLDEYLCIVRKITDELCL